MIITCLYRHEDYGNISFTRFKKSDEDELWLDFSPENGEILPFSNGDGMIPFSEFMRWYNERNLAAIMLTDEQASTIPSLYEEWQKGVYYYDGSDKEHAQSRVIGKMSGLLYKCNIPHESIETWEPENAPTVWTVIDAVHTGTINDPIPAARSMEYTYGLYYFDKDVGDTYLCHREGEEEGGTIVLHYMPHELIGHYFVLAR